MAVMASAAVSAGVACSRTCELVAVASIFTIISCVEASYPARRVLSRRARSHWSVLGRRMRGMSGARWKQFIGAPGARNAAGAKTRGRPQFAASGQADSCGLTGRARPLYSAGFATSACRLMFEGPCGGIGRRARLKIEFRKECWFDSGQGHQVENISNNNNLRHWFDSTFSGKFSRCIENTLKVLSSRPLCWYFCWHRGTSVRGEFRYFERGEIEQMARKNHGARAKPNSSTAELLRWAKLGASRMVSSNRGPAT